MRRLTYLTLADDEVTDFPSLTGQHDGKIDATLPMFLFLF
jgi:hypothetical protein